MRLSPSFAILAASFVSSSAIGSPTMYGDGHHHGGSNGHDLRPQEVKMDLKITNKIIAPDGFYRAAIVAGGTMPGPPILGRKGDRFRLNVINALTDFSMPSLTSIHWHGLYQKGSVWADGPVGVSQCPIVQDHSFEYQFRVPDQAGTFWYHSHYGDQLCDGLRGPLVIYDKKDPFRKMYDVDDESTIITLADWYHYPSSLAPRSAPRPSSTLINGRGRYRDGPEVDLSVIKVQKGKRYRYRLLNMACDPNYTWRIEGHTMTVIETDGVDTKPYEVDELQIFTGQRYSFVVHANQPIDNYLIRARPSTGVDTSFYRNQNSAILRYEGAPLEEPVGRIIPVRNPLQEANLRSLVLVPVPGKPHPGGADVNINLDMGFNISTGQFTINGASFAPPDVPVLLQMLGPKIKAPQELMSSGVIELPLNKVIEITIPGMRSGGVGRGLVPGAPHPFHLHGHDFHVVRSAGSSKYNFVDAIQRDTVNTGVLGDNTTIRFVTDNEGPWLFHCHIDWHSSRGLSVVFAASNTRSAKSLSHNIPQAWNDLCRLYESNKAITRNSTFRRVVKELATVTPQNMD